MIVYGQRSRRLRIPQFLHEFARRVDCLPAVVDRDTVVRLLVDFGEAYAAVGDACCPLRDDDSELLREWSSGMQTIADALCASRAADKTGVCRAIDLLRDVLRRLGRTTVLQNVIAKKAEGFGLYGLFPEQYAIACEQFLSERAPMMLTCVGIRNIGAPLAHVVAAAAARRGVVTQVLTVRPRGHPFNRTLALTERLRCHIQRTVTDYVAVVDEGPGLSGSSFAAVTEALAAAGIRSSRIALFPSWQAPIDWPRSERGRAALAGHASYVGEFGCVFDVDDWVDLSAGRWRAQIYPNVSDWPATQPQHERRKYVTSDRRRIARFAGLGRYGDGALHRAQLLHEAGFGPQPHTLTHGFLSQSWIAGHPVAAERRGHRSTLDRVASYLAFVRRCFPTGGAAHTTDIIEMVIVNLREGIGHQAAATADTWMRSCGHFEEAEIGIDGRMLPHEWIAIDGHLFKTDALDHSADDFFPGSRDICWDLAGAIEEFQLDPDRAAYVMDRYCLETGDRFIRCRLPFYRVAYLAYRLGYVSLAAESLGVAPDGERFRQLLTRYRRSLTRHLSLISAKPIVDLGSIGGTALRE